MKFGLKDKALIFCLVLILGCFVIGLVGARVEWAPAYDRANSRNYWEMVDGLLRPGADNAYDIASAARSIRNTWIDGTATIATATITTGTITTGTITTLTTTTGTITTLNTSGVVTATSTAANSFLVNNTLAGASSAVTVYQLTADVTGQQWLMTLKYADNDDTDADFLRCIDDADDNADVLFSIDSAGLVTCVGVTSTGAITQTGASTITGTIAATDTTANPFTFNANIAATSNAVTIYNQIADVTGQNYLLNLKYTDNNDTDADFIRCIDDAAVNADEVFTVDSTGAITAAGLTISGAGTIATGTGAITLSGNTTQATGKTLNSTDSAGITLNSRIATVSQLAAAQEVYPFSAVLVDGQVTVTFATAFTTAPMVVAMCATAAEYIYSTSAASTTAVTLKSSDGASTQTIQGIAIGDR